MKKKRKKKNSCESLLTRPCLGSAPDVPKNLTLRHNNNSFAVLLFGEKGHGTDYEEKAFEIKVTENSVMKWNTVIHDQKMFIFVPTDLSQAGSKESFVALLEIAEEELGCTMVISCVKNTKSERSAHLRTFMYMGFEAIALNNPILSDTHDGAGDFIFLGYEL